MLDRVSIPHLILSHAGDMYPIEEVILEHVTQIEHWFRERWSETPAALTSSVDLRHAGFKLAPVDTNLFPAGFNNLNPECMPLCVQAAQAALAEYLPSCQRILLIPESHTRNLFYNQSLAVLRSIFQMAGFEVRIGNIDQSQRDKLSLSLPDGASLVVEPIERKNDRIMLQDFDPCFVLLNNDLSTGIPDILKDLNQRIKPTARLGWASRLKSSHFSFYDGVAREFADLIGINHWSINPLFSTVDNIDFMTQEGIDNLAQSVEDLLTQIAQRFKEHNINETPFVAVKADSGTYGMSVMMVEDAQMIRQLNRKQRTKMAASKGSQKVSRVIIQEGVRTLETMQDGSVAEPVIYMIGSYVVGGFYRVHNGRGRQDNLNAPGMQFSPLAFSEPCNLPDTKASCDNTANRFYTYSVIARLAALAAAREVAAIGEAK